MGLRGCRLYILNLVGRPRRPTIAITTTATTTTTVTTTTTIPSLFLLVTNRSPDPPPARLFSFSLTQVGLRALLSHGLPPTIPQQLRGGRPALPHLPSPDSLATCLRDQNGPGYYHRHNHQQQPHPKQRHRHQQYHHNKQWYRGGRPQPVPKTRPSRRAHARLQSCNRRATYPRLLLPCSPRC